MRKYRRQAVSDAQYLAMEVLDRARHALRQAGGAGPQTRPRATCAIPIAPVQSPWQAWMRQQPEIVTIALCLGVCLIGVLHGS